MTTWKVIEPYIDLLLKDTPLFYTKSDGQQQGVRLTYKQRNTRPYTGVFSFGPNWECNLLTYFFVDSGGNLTLFAFDAGQGLTEHTSPFEAVVMVLDGACTLTIGGTPVRATPGTVVRMPADVPHALEAIETTRLLLVMLREPKRE
jgi:mannose-6-phosphate isomerase-like protein (cupin superfamily)